MWKQEDGTAKPSFVATHLSELASEGKATQDDIDDIRGAAGTIYSGMIHISPDFPQCPFYKCYQRALVLSDFAGSPPTSLLIPLF
jgi:hypothetical protein